MADATSKINAQELLITQLLRERFPNYNLTRGSVIHKALIRPAAMLATDVDERIQDLYSVLNIAAVRAIPNPESIDRDGLEMLLSNYRMSRRRSSAATGTLVVVMSRNLTSFISTDTVFTAIGGQTFRPVEPYVATPDASLKASGRERIIVPMGTDRFAFTLQVSAVEAGSAGRVAARTSFTVNPNIPYVETIYAEADFTGGIDDETNAEMLARLEDAITPEAPASRRSYRKFILNQFPSATDVSVIGAGDPEMVRDKHNIFGLSTYGKVDVYVRTAPVPTLVKLTKTVSRIPGSNSDLLLSMTSDLTDFPGFYRVEHILPAGSPDWTGSLPVVSDSRGVNINAVPGVRPFIGTVDEAVYSPYQTSVIRFTDYTAIHKADRDLVYDVYVRYMPMLHDVQAYVGGRDLADPGGDALVRAPIPCFVAADVTIMHREGYVDTGPELTARIQTEVAAAVNRVPFSTPQLSVGVIISAVYDILGDNGYVDLPLILRGRILAPDGSEIILRDGEGLSVPTDINRGVSRAVTAFYMLPENLGVVYKAI